MHIYRQGQEAINLAPMLCGLALVIVLATAVRTRRLLYALCCGLFLLYVLVAVSQTIFPLFIDAHSSLHERGFSRGINLIPFYTGEWGTNHLTHKENLLNIALTIPWGLGVGFVLPLRRRALLPAALLGGFVFEGTQIALSLFVFGYPYRSLDINDLIFNLTGAMIGYALFMTLGYFYRRAAVHLPLLRRPYFHDVALRAA